MSIIKTRTHQAVVAIVGMFVMGIGLGIVYATGTPTDYFVAEKIKHRDLLDLLAYVLPILAAVAAGAGLFVGYPGVQHATVGDSKDAAGGHGPGEADLKAFYILSLVLLFIGLLCYAACHPCRSPSMIVISGCFLWTAMLILRARAAAAGAKQAQGVLHHHLVSGLTLVVIIAIALSMMFFNTMYIGGMCAD